MNTLNFMRRPARAQGAEPCAAKTVARLPRSAALLWVFFCSAALISAGPGGEGAATQREAASERSAKPDEVRSSESAASAPGPAGRQNRAPTLVWAGAKADAVRVALAEGKQVLLMAGRPTCGNCGYMKNTVCESQAPAIKGVIEQSYVPWFCNVDNSSEWRAYAAGLGSFTLPLICCLDPAHPDVWLDRTTGIQDRNVLYERLLSHVNPPARGPSIQSVAIRDGTVALTLGDLAAGSRYLIESCADLGSPAQWAPLHTFEATGATLEWSEPMPSANGHRFYRVAASEAD